MSKGMKNFPLFFARSLSKDFSFKYTMHFNTFHAINNAVIIQVHVKVSATA